MINTEDVIEWFRNAEEEEDPDFIYELRYQGKDSTFDVLGAPDEYEFKVVINHTDISYDSYGNGYTDDGFIVFSVTNTLTNESANFKLPVKYASYDGWSWNLNDIRPVIAQEKVVTLWEWVDA